MSLLPNSVHREREDSHGDFSQQKAGAAVSRATLPEAYADGASSNHSEDCPRGHGPLTPCPMEEGSPVMASSVVSGEVTPRGMVKFVLCHFRYPSLFNVLHFKL